VIPIVHFRVAGPISGVSGIRALISGGIIDKHCVRIEPGDILRA
jgi:hypothetical protein